MERNSNLLPGLWLISSAGWLPRNRDQLDASNWVWDYFAYSFVRHYAVIYVSYVCTCDEADRFVNGAINVAVNTVKQSTFNTSTPVIRTGVIPTCRSPSPPAVASLSHWPRSCPASLSHLAKDCPMHYRFFTFWPWGLTPGPKFTKKGEDLLATQVYHPAKFRRPASTHDRDIRYKVLRTNV